MSAEGVLKRAKEVVDSIVPASVEITQIDFEGSVVVIYTKSIDEFADNNDIVRQLAQALRRRVAIRPDPSLLMDAVAAEEEILKIIPDEAKVTDVFFEADTGEVTVEAIAPGLAIGKHGAILNEIKKAIGWAPKVVRTPPIPSKTVKEIRGFLRSIQDERKEFLKKVGHRLNREMKSGENWVRFTSLGGYRQVGRSCTLLNTRDSKVMIDCGVDPGNDDRPFLHAPEVQPLEYLDAIVITHAHLDHCGLMPALFKYGYEGPIYATPPTRDMMTLLLLDSVKVSANEAKKLPFESQHIREAIKHTICLRYGETTDISPDIRLTFHNAGHILGSAISHFHVGDGLYNIAFTGDIKYEKTWLFNQAVNKFPRLEAIVMESTYGGHRDTQPPRREASESLKEIISRTFHGNGKVLIPVFAVGRSQEVMIVIESLMRTGEVPTRDVWLDGMIWEATAIHTAYPEYLNSQLRTQIFQRGENPFLSEIFNRVDGQDTREKIINDADPCIVLATAGMMNGGPVLEYFKCWAENPANTLVFVGFNAEGTLGRKVQKGWKEITLNNRPNSQPIPVNMSIENCDGFSGHSDRKQLLNFVGSMEPRPEKVFICHGDEAKSMDLASSLHKKYGMTTLAPMNLETIRLR